MDGNDCVMLSNESAIGDNPVESCEFMAKICVEAEKTIDYKRAFNDVKAEVFNAKGFAMERCYFG